MSKQKKVFLIHMFLLLVIIYITGCAPTIPKPNEIVSPEPIYNNSGKYLCPYTSDGVVAPWVSKGIYAKAGAAIGSYAGKKLGQELLENIPIFGSTIGQELGETMGRKIALEMAGGIEYMKETSDLSFDEINKMIIYLYVNYSDNEHWKKVWDLTSQIYPEINKYWQNALISAQRIN